MRKSKATPEFWATTWRDACKLVPEERTKRLAEQAMMVISDYAGRGRIGTSYSGGKDGLVVYDLACRVGVRDGFASLNALDYPRWIDYVKTTAGKHVAIQFHGEYDFDWLEKNPRFIFPANPRVNYEWYRITHWKTQLSMKGDLFAYITGRRIQDDNWCGRVSGYLTEGERGRVLNPIKDWTHAELFAYIQRRGITLPFWYDTPEGFEDGPVSCIEEMSAFRKTLPAAVMRGRALNRVRLREPAFADRIRWIMDKTGVEYDGSQTSTFGPDRVGST